MGMITLNDAVEVAAQICKDWASVSLLDDDMAYIRQELEQKVWLVGYPKGDPIHKLMSIISDITPSSIAEQISTDSLNDWCEQVRISAELALVQLKGADDVYND